MTEAEKENERLKEEIKKRELEKENMILKE